MKTIKSWARLCGVLLFAFGIFLAGMQPSPAIADTVISHAPESASATILEPANNGDVDQTFTVKFGLSGMGVAPAGVDVKNTGHHHLLVDLKDLPPLDQPLPGSEHILHFGGGQTETELSLAPGKHTLQLILGNYEHVPHDNPVTSEKITVNVG
ncbi:MAG: DUF4399 domain-containing protein [Cyanobacteria bacterium P01_F01_bin.3]